MKYLKVLFSIVVVIVLAVQQMQILFLMDRLQCVILSIRGISDRLDKQIDKVSYNIARVDGEMYCLADRVEDIINKNSLVESEKTIDKEDEDILAK